jgi:hypothetical protein
VTWRLPIDPTKSTSQRLVEGRLDLLEGRAVLAISEVPTGARVALAPPTARPNSGTINVVAGGAAGFVPAGTGTALRFRYFVVQAGPVLLTLHNATKKADFSFDLKPVVGHWTTLTLPVRDLAAPAAAKVACDPGDRLSNLRWEADGMSGLLIDRVEVLEIRR